MTRSREQVIRLDHGSLHLRAVGDGHPIIVLHGGPDFDHSYLVPELDGLADLGRLVYYDQRGRGRSYRGERPDDVTIAREMADLDAVRAWTGSERAVLLGHSWGTLLGLEYAVRHPGRVSHLVLLNPAPASSEDAAMLRAHLDGLRTADERARIAALRADPRFVAGDAAVESEYYAIHFRTAVADPANLPRILGRLRRHFTAEGIVAARAIEQRLLDGTWRVATYDLLPLLAGIDVPTLVVRGHQDFIPQSIARRIAEAIPQSRFLELAGCGHFSSLERPDAVHAAVARLLGGA
jgi:proline iminopeptidase